MFTYLQTHSGSPDQVRGRPCAPAFPVRRPLAATSDDTHVDVDLRLLRHALTLSEHRNFARAAAALGITQPALSRSVQNLEHVVGTAIFDRRPQGVEPTDAGRVFLQRAREFLSLADEFAREIGLARGLQRGRIACGAGPYPGETIVVAAAGRFAAQYPGIQIELRIRSWDDLARSLRARELDFFVAESSTLEDENDLETIPLGRHPLYLVGRSGHPLVGRSVTLENVLAFPLVSPSRIPPRLLAPLLRSRPGSANPVPDRAFPSVECGSISALKQIVAFSDAVTALTLPLMRDELAARRLTVLHTEPWMHTGYGVVRLKNRSLTAAAETFLTMVRQEEDELTRLEAGLAKTCLADGKPGRKGRRRG